MDHISQDEIKKYRERGYNESLLPKGDEQRTWTTYNYFTLWMGSVHNVPNYVTVGGFLALGLSTFSVMAAVVISSLFIAFIMVFNGAAGAKYGIPFSMLLRSSYGIRGSLFPGFLRGCIAAIMWFGLQCYAGSLALEILIGKIWPGFIHLGGDTSILGISLPGLICFIIFWLVNVGIGLGGGSALNKLTAILNPCLYILFIGMAVWAVMLTNFSDILHYVPKNVEHTNPSLGLGIFLFFGMINSVVSVWAAPAVSASDFTQSSKSFKQQAVGQTSGLVIAHILYAIASVCVLAGASIHYGSDTWNVLNIIERWDNIFAILFAVIVILMATVSTNAAGNIIPAGYQISALFPKKISYKQGVIIASIISLIICPWKLMEHQDSIISFLSIIGGILGPVLGVMLAHYFVVIRRKVDLNTLYTETGKYKYYDNGFNVTAFIVTIIAVILSLGGRFIPVMEPLYQLSWFVGVIVAFVLYAIFKRQVVVKGDK